MIQEKLRSLQLIELKILLEVKRICEKHSINYFLIGGTLLGSVRHHGFIPWDDDIDIGMLREDYVKFLDVALTELGSDFYLQTINSDSGYCNIFGKIRINNTDYPEEINLHVLNNRGIWIDIFPFDNIPNSNLKRMCQSIIFGVLESTLWFKYRYQYQKSPRFFGRVCQNGCKILSFIIPKQYLLKIREFIVQKYNKHTTEYIRNWPFNVAKREYFNELTELPFETVQFPVPKMYHEYLTSYYGDYMKIPPENERPKHSPYEPDFGKYAYIKTLDDVLPKKE